MQQTPPMMKPPVEDACSLPEIAKSLRTSAGGRLRLLAEGVTYVLPPGWRAKTVADEVIVRVPPDAVSTQIEVLLNCDENMRASLQVEVVQPYWSSLPRWSEAEGPQFVQVPNLFMDPQGRLLMFGGFQPRDGFDTQLWAYSFDKSQWDVLGNLSNAPTTAGGDVAVIPGETAFMFLDGFSGWSNSAVPFTILRVDYGERVEWSESPVERAPTSGWYSGSFEYAPSLDRFVSACGSAEAGIHCEVGLYNPHTGEWERPTVLADDGLVPDGRYGFVYTYDPEGDRLVLASGGRQPVGNDMVNAASDTWALELSQLPLQWRKLTNAELPGRRNPCYAYDSDGHRLIAWGGTDDGRTVTEGLWSLDLDPGHEQWTRIDAGLPPPARSGCGGAYDPVQKRVVFGFGNTGQAVFADLQALHFD